jgi:hypothetical protein
MLLSLNNMIKRKEKYFYETKKKIITKKNMSFDVQ